jgi:UTP--glucose-1-phosphate uridylyltransferase
MPLTKAIPKEMLPLLDKPVIQWTVEELVDSGIDDITIVVSPRKNLVQQHFAPDGDLDAQLRAAGKPDLADALVAVSSKARIKYVYQDGPYGNGTAVLNAARTIGREPFLVLWSDEIFTSPVPRARQLLDAYERMNAPVIGLIPVEPASVSRYGIPVLEEDLGDGLFRISGVVEKPALADAPSAYASIGGYVVTPEIVDELERAVERWTQDSSVEIYLSAAINAHAAGNPTYGQLIKGTWWDTGDMLGYLRTQFSLALGSETYGPDLLKFMTEYAEGLNN